MKKLLTLFMCFALVGLYSCGSDDDDNGGDDTVKLTASFKYMKDNVATASPLTIMYLYDTKGEDTSGWVYDSESSSHTMKRPDNTVVYPKYSFISEPNKDINENIDNNVSYIYIAICGVDYSQTVTDKFKTNGAAIKIEKTLTANN
ncbi:hypothetical protein FACS1894179_06880 [Bacteroidia bacterium]|nr:hypothetical protein FACS1894179_06880 [Bacteroidia bacterium]